MAKAKDAATSAPMGFDSIGGATATRAETNERPVCPVHYVAMKAYSSPENVTYYKCPVEGCVETSKKARRADTVFTEPKTCSRAACQSQPLEVDKDRSTPRTLVMVCPNCSEEQRHPRPGVAVPRVSEHAPAANFDDR